MSSTSRRAARRHYYNRSGTHGAPGTRYARVRTRWIDTSGFRCVRLHGFFVVAQGGRRPCTLFREDTRHR